MSIAAHIETASDTAVNLGQLAIAAGVLFVGVKVYQFGKKAARVIENPGQAAKEAISMDDEEILRAIYGDSYASELARVQNG